MPRLPSAKGREHKQNPFQYSVKLRGANTTLAAALAFLPP